MLYQILLVIVSITLHGVETPKPNFSGNWIPDEKQSTSHKRLKTDANAAQAQAPPPPPPDARLPAEQIVHREPILRIVTRSADGGRLNLLSLSTNGRESLNQLASGALTHRSRSRWEGDTLVTKWQLHRQGKKMIEGIDQRLLSEDGKVLTLKRHTEDGNSVSDAVIVFRKQL